MVWPAVSGADVGYCDQANILVDSKYRARLADFGLAMITDEPAGRTTNSGGEMKGTTRWMAPELMDPEEFGFAGELLKRLPSTSTDIYAIGMTILEVSASLYLLEY